MKTLFYASIFTASICPQLIGAEVETSHRTILVKEDSDEIIRHQIVSIFGDLDKYLFLWIYPETGLHVSALLESEEQSKKVYDVLYWRKGLRKDQVVTIRLTQDNATSLIQSTDRIFVSATQPKPEKKDYLNPERIFLFKRYKNVDIMDWTAVSVRLNSKNNDFITIRNIMLPKPDDRDKADVSNFIQEK